MKLGQVAGLNSTTSIRRDAALSTRNSGILSSFMGSLTTLTRAGSLSPSGNESKSEVQPSRMGMRTASESSSMTSSNLGTVTGNIEFANVQSKKISIAERKKDGVAKEQVTYKLIDFGSAVGIHEDETAGVHDHENMMTATELEFAGYRLLHAHQVLVNAE